MRRVLTPVLVALVAVAPAQGQAIPADDPAARDERLLRDNGIGVDGPALLAFFRQHTTTQADVARIEQLLKELGADRFRVRQEASARLAAIGERAVPSLRTAEKSSDPEVARRASRCLLEIKAGASEALLSAAARLVAVRKPDGAAQVLLDYVPFAEQAYLARQVRDALAAVAIPGGRPDPALVAALEDRSAPKRAAAGVALARAGKAAAPALPAVRKLLQDPKAQVRLHVGLALASVREKEALPALIGLLDELPPEELGEVEGLLYAVAGDKAPDVPLGPDAEERRKVRTAWEDWYKTNKDDLDAARLEEALRPRDHTLVVLLNEGRVVDLDAQNRARWQVDGLKFPLDAQYLPGDRVLVAEYEGGRVSERNNKGEVVWEKKLLQPLVAQRLPGGHTFIATATLFVEVDRDGKEVWRQPPPVGGRVMKAVRLRNGHVACVVMVGTTRFFEVDREGKPVRTFGVELSTSGGRIDVLGNGHVLIPEKDTNRIVEHDAQGRRVWEASFAEPIAAVRLPNGNTLVTSYQSPRAVEIDRKGKEVWEYKSGTRVTRAIRH